MNFKGHSFHFYFWGQMVLIEKITFQISWGCGKRKLREIKAMTCAAFLFWFFFFLTVAFKIYTQKIREKKILVQ